MTQQNRSQDDKNANRGSDADYGEAAKHAAGDAAESAKQVGRKAAHEAQNAVQAARDSARSSIDAGKHEVAQQVGHIARALRDTSETLRSDEFTTLADQGDLLAQRIEDAEHYLEERSLSELLEDVRAFARRRPAVFVGGMFALGLAAARFLQTSGRTGEYSARYGDRDYGSRDYGNQDYGSRTYGDQNHGGRSGGYDRDER